MPVHTEKTAENDSHVVAGNQAKEKSTRAAAFSSADSNRTASSKLKHPLHAAENEVAELSAPVRNNDIAQQKNPAANSNSVSQNQTLQLFRDEQEASEKGALFRTLSNQEYALNNQITLLLRGFQNQPTRNNHALMMDDIEDHRTRIKALHVQLVRLVNEYESAKAFPAQQMAYFGAYLGDKLETDEDGPITRVQIMAIFNSVAAKTEALYETVRREHDDEIDDEMPELEAPMLAERSRFLMFMMQGLHDDIGAQQYQALDQNLGARKLKVGRVGPNNLSGGLEDFDRDHLYARKTDDGQVNLDEQDWTTGGGTGIGFLASKFGRAYNRGQNPQRGMIGDMQINMDRDDDLMAIFAGMNDDNTELFSGPKKMTVHHEIGHINSMLEGRSGEGKPMEGKLGNLTDQEEMFNIYGGPRSDRAYGRELGLPERFDHGSLVTYFAEGRGGGGDYEDFMDTINKAKAFNSPAPALVTELRRLVDSNWRKITKGIWFKPDGVKAIKTLLGEPNTVPDLAAIRDAAIENRDTDSSKRHPFTQNFYIALAGLDPADDDSISAVFRLLRPMVVPQTWE